MVVGCGISRLSEELYDEGFLDVTSIDFSYTAIKFQQDFYRVEYPKLVFTQMDVRNLTYNDGEFDMVLDKALLDAVICSDGSKVNTSTMMTEIHRVLKPNGVYISLSHGKENQRLKYYGIPKWAIETVRIPKPDVGVSMKGPKGSDPDKAKNHFCYICKKSE